MQAKKQSDVEFFKILVILLVYFLIFLRILNIWSDLDFLELSNYSIYSNHLILDDIWTREKKSAFLNIIAILLTVKLLQLTFGKHHKFIKKLAIFVLSLLIALWGINLGVVGYVTHTKDYRVAEKERIALKKIYSNNDELLVSSIQDKEQFVFPLSTDDYNKTQDKQGLNNPKLFAKLLPVIANHRRLVEYGENSFGENELKDFKSSEFWNTSNSLSHKTHARLLAIAQSPLTVEQMKVIYEQFKSLDKELQQDLDYQRLLLENHLIWYFIGDKSLAKQYLPKVKESPTYKLSSDGFEALDLTPLLLKQYPEANGEVDWVVRQVQKQLINHDLLIAKTKDRETVLKIRLSEWD